MSFPSTSTSIVLPYICSWGIGLTKSTFAINIHFGFALRRNDIARRSHGVNLSIS